jgi:hypothetical protein
MTQIIAPGASTRGFTLAPQATDVAGDLAALRKFAADRKNAHGIRALEALDGTDPLLYGMMKAVRPRVTAILREHDAKLAAARGDAQRRFLNAAGIRAAEDALAAARDAALAKAGDEMSNQLSAIRLGLRERQVALTGHGFSDADEAAAHGLADRLTRLDPSYGLAELTTFIGQVGRGERRREELVALLPILQSAYDHEGTPWTQSGDLLDCITLAESVTDGGWQASVIAARIERADRLATDLDAFLAAARDSVAVETEQSKKMRDLGLSAAAVLARPGLDERDDEGRYRLFPDDVPPPNGAAPETPAERRAPPTDFRRITVSREQRGRDQQARDAQNDDE